MKSNIREESLIDLGSLYKRLADCKIRTMSSTDSGACRPLIPEQIVHYFGQPRMGGRHQMGS